MTETDLEVRIKAYLAENGMTPINDNEFALRLAQISPLDPAVMRLMLLVEMSKDNPGNRQRYSTELYIYLQQHKEYYKLAESRGYDFAFRVASVRSITEFVQNQLTQGQNLVIVDYGCGTGIELCFLAKEFPQNRFIGYDMDVVRLEAARQTAKRYPSSRIRFARGNFFKPEKAELSQADVLYTNSPPVTYNDGKLKQFLDAMRIRVKIGCHYVLMGVAQINTKYIPQGLELNSSHIVCKGQKTDFYAYDFKRTR